MFSTTFSDSIRPSSASPHHGCLWGDGDEDDLVWHYMPYCGNPGGDALLSTHSEEALAGKPSGAAVYPVTAQRHAGGGFPMDVKSNASPLFAPSDGLSFDGHWPGNIECVSETSGFTNEDIGHFLRLVYHQESDAVHALSEQHSSPLLNPLDSFPCSPLQAVAVPSPEMLSPEDARPRVPPSPNFESSRGSVSRHRRPRHPRPQNRPKLNPPPALSKVIPCSTILMAC